MYLFAEEEYSVCVFLQKVKFINSLSFISIDSSKAIRFTIHQTQFQSIIEYYHIKSLSQAYKRQEKNINRQNGYIYSTLLMKFQQNDKFKNKN